MILLGIFGKFWALKRRIQQAHCFCPKGDMKITQRANYNWKPFISLRCFHIDWQHVKRCLTRGNAICKWILMILGFLRYF